MSYQYFNNTDVIFDLDSITKICRQHDVRITAENAVTILDEKYGVFAEIVGFNEIDVFGFPKVSENLGVEGIKNAVEPILEFAPAGDYVFTDEYDREVVVTVD